MNDRIGSSEPQTDCTNTKSAIRFSVLVQTIIFGHISLARRDVV
jgi:hypothetical protein